MQSMLTSHWGLDPVMVTAGVACLADDEHSGEAGKDPGTSHAPEGTAATVTTAQLSTTAIGRTRQPLVASGTDDGSNNVEDDDDELTGKTLWDCAKVLYDLVANPDPGNTFSVKGMHVIELGAGTGALSVGIARAGAASVTCTDLPCHLSRITSTVNANRAVSSTPASKVCTHSCGNHDLNNLGGEAGEAGEANRSTHVRVAALEWGRERDIARVRTGGDVEVVRELVGKGNREIERQGLGTSDDGIQSSDDIASAPARQEDAFTAVVGVNGESVLHGQGNRRHEPACVGRDSCGNGPVAPGAALREAFDVIVLSEVLYWPALDLLQEDTREPLRRTLLGLSKPGTMVVLIYKERWPQREEEFLESCEGTFDVRSIPAGVLTLPGSTKEDPGSDAIRAVVMTRLPSPCD